MAAQSRFVLCKPHHWHVQEMGAGPLVLLVHGAGGATQSWRHLMPKLAERFRCIAIDLPGQGFTKLGGLRRCGLDEMSEDIQSLCAQEGWHPETIIGHSAGAAIALRMAEDISPRPNIIGINAALGNFKGLAGLLFPLMAKALAAVPGVAHMFTASTARPGSVARLIEGTGSTLSMNEQRYYRALVSDRTHVDATLSMMAQWKLDALLARLGRHPARTLLIAADHDKAVPPSTSERAAQTMPRADFAMLNDLGHLAHEEAADRVLIEIDKFLAD